MGGEEVANSQTNKIRNFYCGEILMNLSPAGHKNQRVRHLKSVYNIKSSTTLKRICDVKKMGLR